MAGYRTAAEVDAEREKNAGGNLQAVKEFFTPPKPDPTIGRSDPATGEVFNPNRKVYTDADLKSSTPGIPTVPATAAAATPPAQAGLVHSGPAQWSSPNTVTSWGVKNALGSSAPAVSAPTTTPGDATGPVTVDPLGGKTAAEFSKNGGIFTNAHLQGNTGAAATAPGIDTSGLPAMPVGIDTTKVPDGIGQPIDYTQDRKTALTAMMNGYGAAGEYFTGLKHQLGIAMSKGDTKTAQGIIGLMNGMVGMHVSGIQEAQDKFQQEQNLFYHRGLEWTKLTKDILDKNRTYGLDVAKFEAQKPLWGAQAKHNEAAAKASDAQAGLFGAQAKAAGEKQPLRQTVLKEYAQGLMKTMSNDQISPEERAAAKKEFDTLMSHFDGDGDGKPDAAGTPVGTPKPGDVIKGFRFKGGDPADKNNWVKVS